MNAVACMAFVAALALAGVAIAPRAVADDMGSMPGMEGMHHDHEAPAPSAASPAESQPGSTAPADPANRIVGPNPPRIPMADPQHGVAMPGEREAVMDDEVFHQLLAERLEGGIGHDSSSAAWDVLGWIGKDHDRLWLKAEGERAHGSTDSRIEALWGHAATAFWDTQLGVRHDSGNGTAREWVAFGVQGLAPWWVDIEATLYIGDAGRTAARVRASYDLPLTQRLYLTPEAEGNAYGKSDAERNTGSGLSDLRAGLRLRYEITRQFAPYVGVEWDHAFGATSHLLRDAGEPTGGHRIVAGIRAWF